LTCESLLLIWMPCLLAIYCHNFGRGFFCLLKGNSGSVISPKRRTQHSNQEDFSLYKPYACSILTLLMSASQNVTLTLLTKHIDTKRR